MSHVSSLTRMLMTGVTRAIPAFAPMCLLIPARAIRGREDPSVNVIDLALVRRYGSRRASSSPRSSLRCARLS